MQERVYISPDNKEVGTEGIGFQLSIKTLSIIKMGTVDCWPGQTQSSSQFTLYIIASCFWVMVQQRLDLETPTVGSQAVSVMSFLFGVCLFYIDTSKTAHTDYVGSPKLAILLGTCGKFPPWRYKIKNGNGVFPLWLSRRESD